MNRWSNNYYTPEDSSTRTPRHEPPSSHSQRDNGSSVKTGSDGAVRLYVFRVAHLTQLTLRSLIEHQGVQVLKIDQVSHKVAGYKSFAVSVWGKDASRLLNRSFWPGLVSCRLLQDADLWHNNDMFSRRYTRYSREPYSHFSNMEHTSPRQRQDTQGDIPRQRHSVMDKARLVLPVASHPSYTQVTNGMPTEENIKLNPDLTKQSGRKDGEKPHEPQVLEISSNTNNSVDAKRSKVMKQKGNKPLRGRTKINTIKVQRRNSDSDGQEDHVSSVLHGRGLPVTQRSTRIRIPNLKDFGGIKNKKYKPMSGTTRHKGTSKGILDDKMTSNRKLKVENFSISSGPITKGTLSHHLAPDVDTYKTTRNRTGLTHSNKYTSNRQRVTQSNWTIPLRGLLSMSSKEALNRLLSPDFDRLLTQNNVKDEEIFLGVRVLAHCVRAEEQSGKVQQLVFKICEPQVVYLIKQFTRNIAVKHVGRAERYFWDLGEFLDQYIVHNIFIHGMLSLFTTCLSTILSLNYMKYVSSDLVKVFRGMQIKVFENLP